MNKMTLIDRLYKELLHEKEEGCANVIADPNRKPDAYNLVDEIDATRSEVIRINAEVRTAVIEMLAKYRSAMEETKFICDRIKKVRDVSRNINKIGGAMPFRLRAALDDAFDASDEMLTDSAFAAHLADMNDRNKDPRKLAIACVKDIGSINARKVRIKHRIKKLAERIHNQKSGAERNNAIEMKKTANAALDILDLRIKVVLNMCAEAIRRQLVGFETVVSAIGEAVDDKELLQEIWRASTCAKAVDLIKDRSDSFVFVKKQVNRR